MSESLSFVQTLRKGKKNSMPLSELRKQGADLSRLTTDRERRFVLEYLLDKNGTQAALRAGYSKGGAANVAHRLLKNPIVKAYIGKIERQDIEKLGVDRLMVLERLVEALNWEARDLVDDKGRALKPHELPDRVQRQVDGFEQEVSERELTDGTILRSIHTKIKMTPRATAREQAMKHKGLFAPDELNINVSARKFLEELRTPIPVDEVEVRLQQESQLLIESNSEEIEQNDES